jgi:putative endonuclease
LELIWIADFQTRAEAFELERRLHGWSRAKKEALMRGDFEAIPGLSLIPEVREARALAPSTGSG